MYLSLAFLFKPSTFTDSLDVTSQLVFQQQVLYRYACINITLCAPKWRMCGLLCRLCNLDHVLKQLYILPDQSKIVSYSPVYEMFLYYNLCNGK